MSKNLRKLNQIFLLGIFGMVFAFGVPIASVFADEIPDYMNGVIIRYDYKLSNGSPDWDTFYRRCNQYASQYRYYTIGISDVYGSLLRGLSRFETSRFIFVNRSGAMVTMHFFNESKRERIQNLRSYGFEDLVPLIEEEREFTNYADALGFWKNAVEIMR